MRKIETAMIAAIREAIGDPYTDGPQFKGGNTVVFANGNGVVHTPNFTRWIEVIFYDTVIALIEPQCGRISLYTGGHYTATTKSRLNAILSELSDGLYIEQRKGQWFKCKGGYTYDRFTEGSTVTLRP
jgi:hypothetical protein